MCSGCGDGGRGPQGHNRTHQQAQEADKNFHAVIPPDTQNKSQNLEFMLLTGDMYSLILR